MKTPRILYGLVGVSADGTLEWPDGERMMRLPESLAFRLQRLQHKFARMGMYRKFLCFKWVW